MQVNESEGWTVKLDSQWDVLGPFPIHAREQHFLSPSFPLNLSQPIDFRRTYPSAYADNGQVGWPTTQASESGELKIAFPHIRWNELRKTEGWAAIQHHAVLHTSFTLRSASSAAATPPKLRVDLVQGSYFTILPRLSTAAAGQTPEWYAGNIYAMERALPSVISLPLQPAEETVYDLFVAGDYEIRLFGDPGEKVPVQSIRISVSLEPPSQDITIREPSQDVVCDFVDGWAFGDAIAIGIRAREWISVVGAKAVGNTAKGALELSLLRETRIAPTQTRLVPIKITQHTPFTGTNVQFELTLRAGEDESTLSIEIPVQQLDHWTKWNATEKMSIKASYLFASSMATAFRVIPPSSSRPHPGGPTYPILALHGAGVDAVDQPFWADALPRNAYSWFVLPTGRTSWGLDWHGPSSAEAWASVRALSSILSPRWKDWAYPAESKVVLLGHSNGGQGVWWNAARYPDRVVAAIPAAAYIKSQSYIPLTLSRSARFVDPVLRSVLESALTPDDNDLFTTNLGGLPVLALHGGNDENVPVWHSRELVGAAKSWYPNANITYHEEPGAGHWWDTVFDNDQVKAFLDLHTIPTDQHDRQEKFVLTVAVPSESGSLNGVRIEELTRPGRLSRLFVDIQNAVVRIESMNADRFSVDLGRYKGVKELVVDQHRIAVPQSGKGTVWVEKGKDKEWKISDRSAADMRQTGRIQSILTTPGPLTLVVPPNKEHELSIALRVAHDLLLYHKLDSRIVTNSESVNKQEQGNRVLVGLSSTEIAKYLHVEDGEIPIQIDGGVASIYGRRVGTLSRSLGILFLLPTPSSGRTLVVQSTDRAGLERAARLFPIRTGVSVPDWLIIGEGADLRGAEGVVGAGVWGGLDWTY